MKPQVIAAESATPAAAKTARWLALGAVAGPILFALTWFVLGFLSQGYTLFGTVIAPYVPVSQPISGLGMDPVTAPFMNTAFVLSGLAMIAGVIGVFRTMSGAGRPVARWTSAALLALSPLGLVIDGIFNLEAMFVHLIGFTLAVGTPVLSFAIAGLVLRGIPDWRRFGNRLLLASPLTLALVIVFFQTFDPTVANVQNGVSGLVQRVLAVEVHAWFLTMGWLAFRSVRTSTPATLPTVTSTPPVNIPAPRPAGTILRPVDAPALRTRTHVGHRS